MMHEWHILSGHLTNMYQKLMPCLLIKRQKMPLISTMNLWITSLVKIKQYYHKFSAHWFKLYSKTCVKRPLSKRQKIGFQDQLLLNEGRKYCRMLQGEHSAILSTFIKLPFVFKICFVYFWVAILHRFYCIL